MNYFVTAIGTDSGKTLVSAILCEALKADYWKPIQAGEPKDSDIIKSLITNRITSIHPENYVLNTPVSPHMAARIDGLTISLNSLELPAIANDLIIEGAGGLMVPINDHELVLDLIKKLKAELILVCDLYLGSINHSLLTIDKLLREKIAVKGIIFNGEPNIDSESVILEYAGWPCLLRINKENKVNRKLVSHYANRLRDNWSNE